jgi:NTE family protein
MKKNFLIALLFFFGNILYLTAQEPSGTGRPRVGLALGGGGALGFTHVGVLKVLEENNIPVDIVTGTSMGSIIGAFYALGYSAHDIEHILQNDVDFTKMFDDTLSRRYENMTQKLYKYESRLSVSFDGQFKLEFPSGVSEALEVEDILDYYFWDSGFYKDFTAFPRPFACVATDLNSGKAVRFTSGPLGQAVRASMAFPTIFTPVKMNGMLLSDGGLTRNLPVEDAYDLGAEVVIAVDLSKPMGGKDAAGTLLTGLIELLLSQANEVTEEQRKYASLVITPDLTNYEVYSFNHAAELIRRGEEAARAMLPQLLAYAVPPEDIVPVRRIGSEKVYIDQVQVVGTTVPKLPLNYVEAKIPGYIDRDTLRQQVGRLRYSSYYKRARYNYEGTTLILTVEEALPYRVGINLSYDSDFSLNAGVSGSVLIISPWLMTIQASLMYVNGIENRGYFDFTHQNLQATKFYIRWLITDALQVLYRPPDSAIIPPRRIFNNYYGNIGIAFDITSTHYIEAGFQLEYWSTDGVKLDYVAERYGTEPYYEANSLVTLMYAVDTQDNKYYPREGVNFQINGYWAVAPFNKIHDFMRVDGKFNIAFPLSRSLSMNLGTEGGIVVGDDIALPYLFQIGGLYSTDKRFALTGAKIGTAFGSSAWMFRAGVMYTFLSRFHLIAQWGGGLIDDDYRMHFSKDNFYNTLGLKAAVDLNILRFEQGFFGNFNDQKFYLTVSLGTHF